MKVEKSSVSSVPAERTVRYRSAVGLSRIALALFISVMLSGFAAAQVTGCPLNSPGGSISHIVYIHFDNVHLEQDNPNVASDLVQMPNLYNFIVNNGTLLTNHHTTLISHTSDNILTTETGVYGDRHGQAVANGFVAVNSSANKYWDEFPSSFTYWTDPVETAANEDSAYSMITAAGQNAPAPWVPFTRAGCNVGAVSIANLEMENTSGDIANVYGKSSPQYAESTTQAALDFEGIAIHCAAGDPLCTSSNSTACTQSVSNKIMGYNGVCAEPDVLPQEPGGYNGYNGLFGHVYVAGAICPSCPVTNGRPTVNDLSGNAMTGFPGFSNISAAQTLGYVAQMLENGVPIVFSYISDLHDCHTNLPTCTLTDGYYRALGPGESSYETQIQAYNTAFGEFFTRLQSDGIDSSNTLFIVTADEQDHFVGGPASPASCDGVNTPCTYTYPNGYTPPGNDSGSLNLSVGEVEGDLTQLYQQQFPSLVPPSSTDAKGPNSGLTASGVYDWHYDMAPAVYLNPYLSTNTPSFARQLERATAQLTGVNPITGNTDHLTNYLVDYAGLNALHMVTGDPNRTPTFVMFANPNWYFQEQAEGSLVLQEQDYAYNHGGVAPEINATWLGLVGPGIANNGLDNTTWSDHTDTRATLLYLTGLTDDYQGDGRVLVEDLVPTVLPPNLQSNLSSFEQLAAAYKQMNAPVGSFGQAVLQGSTTALASGSTSSDTQYTTYVNTLTQLTSERNTLASSIKSQLYSVEYQGGTLGSSTANSLAVQADGLVLNLNTSTASFGQQSVGAPAPVQTFTFSVPRTLTLSAVNILTNGQPGLDYTDGGNSTCSTGAAYTTAQTCTVTVAFTPSAPGLRSGAVTLYASDSNVPLAIWYLNGVGQSSAVTIDAGTQSTLATLSNNGVAKGVAVDGAGNVYVVDNANSQVIKLAAQTFSSSTIVSSGLLNPTALALDGAGNLFISDTGNNRVVEIPNEQGTLNSADLTVLTVTGLGSPSGLAIDGSGNLYVADTTNGKIWENPTGGAPTVAFATGLTSPRGIAVDNAGNVYVANANQVTEYPAGGGSPTAIGSGFSGPTSVAVDPSAAVYVADAGNSRIVRVAPGGASQAALPATGVGSAQGLALDASANVYFTTAGTVNQINRTQPSLTFPSTSVGSSSPAQTVTVSNSGNQTLNFSSVAASANFTVVPSGGTDCTSSTQLASSLQCLIAVEFAPTSGGSQSGTLTLTDNALGVPAGTQTVGLSGGGSLVSQTINCSGIPNSAVFNGSFTASCAATSGLAVTYSSSGSCTNSNNSYTMTSGAGTCLVIANQSGNSEYAAAQTVTSSVTATPASQTVSFGTKAPGSAAYGSSFGVTATATSSLTVSFTASGSCSVVDNGNGSATYTITSGSGLCLAFASQAGNSNYSAAATISESTTATKATPAVTFTGLPSSVSYGSTYPLTATTNASTTAVIASSSKTVCTVSGSTVTIVRDSGTCTVTATWAADANYNAATASQYGTAAKDVGVASWSSPAAISYGTPLSSTQLDATISPSSDYNAPTYLPAAGKIEPVGTYTLKATFAPANPNYTTVTTTTSLVVNPAATTTTITSSDQTVTENREGVASATVDFTVDNSYKPTGSVVIQASTGESCSGNLTATTGTGHCKLSFTSTGTRTLTATYSGDANHTASNNSSQSPAITVTVNP